MAPNLETFKHISSRINFFRNHRPDQNSTDSEKSPQHLLTQIRPPSISSLNFASASASAPAASASDSASTSISPSAGPAQAKKTSEVSRNKPPTMALKQGSNLPRASKSTSTYTKMPTFSSTSSSIFAGSSAGAPATNMVADGSSLRVESAGKPSASNSKMLSQGLGSKYNPIDLTDNTPENDFQPSYHSTFETPKALKQHSWTPTASLPHTAHFHPTTPVAPAAPATQDFVHPGLWALPGYPNHSYGPMKYDEFPPMFDTWSLADAGTFWDDPSVPPGANTPSLGPPEYPKPTVDEMAFQNSGSWFSKWAGSSLTPPFPYPNYPQQQPNQGPQFGGTAMDVDSPEDSSESSADQDELPEEPTASNEILSKLEPLQQFVRECLRRTCPKCPTKRALDAKDVVNMTTGWAKDSDNIVLGTSCQGRFCQAFTCLGCGKAIYITGMGRATSSFFISGKKVAVYWCCDDGRLAAIWALACGWKAPTPKPRTVTRVVNKVRERSNTKFATTHGGHSHSTQRTPANAKGIGYGSERPEYHPFSYFQSRLAPRPIPERPIDTQEDSVQEAYFKLLAALLPSPTGSTDFDFLPPFYFSHMLSRSPLVEMTAMMLNNGSMEEMSRHCRLHDAMLDFFEALGNHPATTGLLYNDRNLYHAKGGSLLEVSIPPVHKKAKLAPKDTSKPLTTLLEKMATQSRTVLRHARANPTEFQNTEGRDLLTISQRLINLSAHHMSNMQLLQTEMDTSDGESIIDFSQWHRENNTRDTPDESILNGFAFTRELERMSNAIPARGRMKRLITEISTLQTSLPEGIFICHGSSRLDIMKVLIIGPKGTPYEHGLFEFDLWCPPDYPNSAPKMKYKTTNNGRTRFNPNLYEDGTICLSLLGTWSGEPWRANKSTILQVLVSIQAMILCEQPWYNEPGRELNENKSLSTKYNNDIRSWTLQYALLPWINALSAKNTDQGASSSSTTSVEPLWKETARLFLCAKARDIISSSNQAASRSRKMALQGVAKTVESTLRAKGFVD
ncbi:uncharacterized protein F4822DRAFT_426299 [Hypoxylon trugodes]|uniref:uncharacterized protein n=1 Tax=Hypoxylon trugodes TaxID=326681 RepID=UPI002192A117|nr:uncharacterized protein F4822DRAFT_426299 [Hypoxylon trugodes]KAI1390451.1 hypothetical protein F4822DRAFT_426299 [Hypoxylon trugodes]